MKEVIDRKFQILAVNPCNCNIYTEQNSLLLCAKDKAVPAALEAYMKKCRDLGCSYEHLESISLTIERVREYQKKHPHIVKIPDTDLPCEIDRCIGGNV